MIAELGIKLVIDFRVDREVDEHPSRLPDHPELRRQRLPIGGDEVEGRSIIETIQAGDLTTYTVEEMAGVYERLLEESAHELRRGRSSTPPTPPTTRWCSTAPPARTAPASWRCCCSARSGVSDDDIVTDYELTTHYRSNKRLAILGPELEKAGVDIEPSARSSPPRHRSWPPRIAALEARYGSIERYLLDEPSSTARRSSSSGP